MKIVVADGATLNPGDISWQDLLNIGDCEIYPNSTPEQCLERCKDADIVVTNKVVFNEAVMETLPNLKMISVTATGYDVVDVKAAANRGIIVTNVPEYGTKSVAQMVFALLLELSHHIGYHSETVYNGKWSKCESFCYWDRPLIELSGLTLGIVGCGRIGQNVATIANAFGMKVVGYDLYALGDDANPGFVSAIKNSGIELVDFDSLLKDSDVISLHCPLTDSTNQIIDKQCLTKMKNTSLLINTSRGALINEADLSDALNNELIAGAGLDVLSKEPPIATNPLLTAKNCYVTPHIAWATKSARARLMTVAIDNVAAFIGGKPQNKVS